MQTMLLTLLLVASLPAYAQTADHSQPEGTISGTVLDEHGEPFKGVQVCNYMRVAPSPREASGDCAATTDAAGQFSIHHLAMGAISVEAIKLDDGYVAFAGTSVKDEVTLTPDQPSATVVLKLGPKPAMILASVKDSSTGKPVPVFQVGWAISNVSGGQTISQVNERALVAPDKSLVITISANGYKTWTYHDPSDPSRPATIRFEPGEERKLLVELEPEAPAEP